MALFCCPYGSHSHQEHLIGTFSGWRLSLVQIFISTKLLGWNYWTEDSKCGIWARSPLNLSNDKVEDKASIFFLRVYLPFPLLEVQYLCIDVEDHTISHRRKYHNCFWNRSNTERRTIRKHLIQISFSKMSLVKFRKDLIHSFYSPRRKNHEINFSWVYVWKM